MDTRRPFNSVPLGALFGRAPSAAHAHIVANGSMTPAMESEALRAGRNGILVKQHHHTAVGAGGVTARRGVVEHAFATVRACAVTHATAAPQQSTRRCPPHVEDSASGRGCSPEPINSRTSYGGRVSGLLRSCTFAAQRASRNVAVGKIEVKTLLL